MPKTYSADLVEEFKTKAAAANAIVHEAGTITEAIPYLIEICEQKAPCELLIEEPGTPEGPYSPNGVPTRVQRIIAAPDLDESTYTALEDAAQKKGILCIRNGLRQYLAGVDLGITHAVLGVAASGTCMIDTSSEEVRLASMTAEVSILILRKSEIVPDLPSTAQKLREKQKDGRVSYMSFITGPSRTADIERVSAIGVHGPLKLHIILLEG